MMNRIYVFAFRVSPNERQLIVELAKQMQRSQSDAVRHVVLEAVKKLAETAAITPAAVTVKKQEGENVTD